MTTEPTQMARSNGPHFLSHITPAPFVPSARTAEDLRDACTVLAGKIENAGFNASAPACAGDELARWEEQLLRLAADVAVSEQDAGALPRELAQAAVRDWRRLARSLALANCQAACDELLRQFLRDAARRCGTSLRDVNNASRSEVPHLLFDAWLRTGVLHLEALAHGPAAAETDRQLTQLRKELRSKLQVELAHTPSEDLIRQRWSNELVDWSEAVLTAADDLSPRLASAQMELVAADIDWFLAHVETPRGPHRRRLRRKRGRLLNEAQERLLQGRLDQRFGRRNAALFDQLVLGLILFVLVLLFLETALYLTPSQLFWLHLADAAACGVFLCDFGVRLAFAPHRGRWFLRHFLIDLIPSLPYGLLLSGLQTASRADLVRLGRIVRLLRVQPLIRMFRAFGFMARGLDRLARRFAPLLNRSVILYPTRAERVLALGDAQRLSQRVRRVHLELQDRWKQLVLAAPGDERTALAAARLDPLRNIDDVDLLISAPAAALRASAAREVPAEVVLRRLGSMTPRHVLADLGEEGAARLARVVRIFSRPPLCWLPVLRWAAPRIGAWMSDGQIVAAAARQLAAVLKIYHDRWFWLADLHGTLTPSVFVDRLGTMLVKGSFRPAYRLALFGGVYLVVYFVVWLMPFDFLARTERFLGTFVGPALLLLGSICCIVFSLGWWLKRLAREATEFYEQAAEAQFLALTEMIRSRHLERDARIFHHRVLRPEWQVGDRGHISEAEQIEIFQERVRSSLLGTSDGRRGSAASDMVERVVLLYRDSLDGAMFVDNDNRTTCQLLGNPSVRQFLRSSLRVGRKQVKALRYLDLERQKSLFGGPYVWFNFISRAVAHNVACLIVDYNRHAIGLEELPLAPTDERRRYERWLATRSATNAMPGDVPATTDERTYLTTAFTALHFLDFDRQRDQEVEHRFGPEMLARLRRDRSLLIRRVFGTYPWHREPREKRILNLYALYERWLAGGRALLLPLFLLWGALRRAWRWTTWIIRAVKEIRHPELRVDRAEETEADFATAVRKIERMRGPVVYATLRLRAAMDPEFLGVPVPHLASECRPISPKSAAGFGETRLHSTGLEGADVDSDLRFLDAEPWIVERIERDRQRAAADMRRLSRLIDEGLLDRAAAMLELPSAAISTPAHLRAIAVAYLADFRGLRRLLSAQEIISEVFERAPLEPPQPKLDAAGWILRRVFLQYCRQHHIDNQETRSACWWAAQQNFWGAADALRIWRRHGDAARSLGEKLLAEIVRHPGRITEQLVTMRTIQTLAILDVLNYRQHVYELGQYAAAGEAPEQLLRWETLGAGDPALAG